MPYQAAIRVFVPSKQRPPSSLSPKGAALKDSVDFHTLRPSSRDYARAVALPLPAVLVLPLAPLPVLGTFLPLLPLLKHREQAQMVLLGPGSGPELACLCCCWLFAAWWWLRAKLGSVVVTSERKLVKTLPVRHNVRVSDRLYSLISFLFPCVRSIDNRYDVVMGGV